MKMKEKVFYVVILLVLVGAVSLFISQRVESKTRAAALFDNERFLHSERLYKEAVNQILISYNCFESGINLTREVDLEGNRTYQVYLHNQRFDTLSKEEFEKLSQELMELTIEVNSTVSYSPSVSFSRQKA